MGEVAGRKDLCESRCTWSLPEPVLCGAKILRLQMLMERLILGPTLWTSCLVCRVLLRVLQESLCFKATVLAYVFAFCRLNKGSHMTHMVFGTP